MSRMSDLKAGLLTAFFFGALSAIAAYAGWGGRSYASRTPRDLPESLLIGLVVFIFSLAVTRFTVRRRPRP